MGQYWKAVNLDKREYVHAHKLGSGLKLWEQLANHPGPGAALIILCAAHREVRGGGDLSMDSDVAKRTIGRWAGDRVVLVGDYAENEDLPSVPDFADLYGKCTSPADLDPDEGVDPTSLYTDVTDDVCAVIEAELNGTFTGTGWRHFEEKS